MKVMYEIGFKGIHFLVVYSNFFEKATFYFFIQVGSDVQDANILYQLIYTVNDLHVKSETLADLTQLL